MKVLKRLAAANLIWVITAFIAVFLSIIVQFFWTVRIGMIADAIVSRKKIELKFVLVMFSILLASCLFIYLKGIVGKYATERMAHTLRMDFADNLLVGGKQVVPVEYRDIELTEQGVAVALKDYTMCMLNYDGTLKYKFICSGVDEVYYPTSETTSDGEDVQKLSPCKSYYTFDGHRGLMAPDGRPLTLPIFTSINGVNENLYYCRFFYADCGILLDGNGKLVNNSDIETKESGK